MKIIEKIDDKNILKITTETDEESLLFLVKTYLEKEPEVDIVGVSKDHHLIDKTEFFLKTKKGSANSSLKKALAKAKKELATLKVK